jgi:hypothetical protein
VNHGKTIRIYLADGSPTGIRHAELVNWTGQAIVCPRSRIGELNKWPESRRPGVYFLFGDDDSGSMPHVYIGEAENVLYRLQNHLANKEFWGQVVFFTSKDENLTKSHVKYLEARLVQLAASIGRCVLENGNAPSLPALPRSDRDAMEEFLEPLRVLLGSLGFLTLQPLPTAAAQSRPAEAAAPTGQTLFFKLPKRGLDARGAVTDEGFVVYAGSVGDANVRDSLSDGWRALREDLIASGSVKVEGSTLRFEKNGMFKSPSAAAAVLSGGVYNGRTAWKNEAGQTLNDLENAVAERARVDAPPGSSGDRDHDEDDE